MSLFRPKQPYFGLRGGWLLFWITVTCGVEMTLYGYDQGVFSGVNVSTDYLVTHNLVGPSKTTLLGTVTAIYDIGCFLGCILAFWIGEKLGRKKTILLGTAVMLVGAVLQTSSYSVGQMMAARVISGIGNGLNSSTVPVWQTETSTSALRGKLVIFENALLLVGFSLANWFNYGFSFVSGPLSWRFPIAVQLIFIITLFFLVPWLPESPRWLVIVNRHEEAMTILGDLEGKELDDPTLLVQMQHIKNTVEYERVNAVSWRDILTGRSSEKAGTKSLRRLILGMGTQAMQQFSGINVTSYYLPTVLTQSVGLSDKLSRLLAACNSVQYLCWAFLSVLQIDRWGRRKMLIFGAAGQCFCYIIITVLLRYNEMPGYLHRDSVASASVAFFFLYYVFFGIGMQGVPWLYPTEINSLTMRTKGAAIGAATNWILNFMVVEITPIGIQNLKWRFYVIWIVLNAAMVPAVYLFYPETAGRTLEDIDEYYRTNPPLFVFRDKEAISTKRPDRLRMIEEEDILKDVVTKAEALHEEKERQTSHLEEAP